jgi:hypothetical protein
MQEDGAHPEVVAPLVVSAKRPYRGHQRRAGSRPPRRGGSPIVPPNHLPGPYGSTFSSLVSWKP